MMSGFVPQKPWERRKTLKSFRPMFIKEVTNGKKTEWSQLNPIEKMKVEKKCLMHYNMLKF